jgi:hypothetical protein
MLRRNAQVIGVEAVDVDGESTRRCESRGDRAGDAAAVHCGYKARVLREAAACSKPGEIGALLRREGLYASHLRSWREQQKAWGQHLPRG